MATISLRARLLLGAVLWTFGLFVVTGVVPPPSRCCAIRPRLRLLHSIVQRPRRSASSRRWPAMVAGLWHGAHGAVVARPAAVAPRARCDGASPVASTASYPHRGAALGRRSSTPARTISEQRRRRGADQGRGPRPRPEDSARRASCEEAERVAEAGHRELSGAIERAGGSHATPGRLPPRARARRGVGRDAAGAHCGVAESAEGLARTLLPAACGSRPLARRCGRRITTPSGCSARISTRCSGNLLDNAMQVGAQPRRRRVVRERRRPAWSSPWTTMARDSMPSMLGGGAAARRAGGRGVGGHRIRLGDRRAICPRSTADRSRSSARRSAARARGPGSADGVEGTGRRSARSPISREGSC